MILIGRRSASLLGLPFPTIFLASPAHSIGGFGLVGGHITIPYHPLNLGQTLPQETFTKYYHRGDGLTIDQKHQVGHTVKGGWFAGLAVW